jgi:uncharacterized protein (DUF433 family)
MICPDIRKLGAMKRSSVVHSDPDILGGTPVFAGTRVPVQTLLDYLEGGESIDDLLDGFPSVKREQIVAFLKQAKDCPIAQGSCGSCSTSASTGASRER